MILQTFRDLEQRWRNAATCRGDLGEQESLEACADDLAAVREALEARLEQAVAFMQEIAEMERCDDPDKRRECSSGSGPYCETHDPIVIDVEIEQARVIMADLAACLTLKESA